MIHSCGKTKPKTAHSVFIAWNAEVCGAAELAENASVWFSATVRADIAPIRIGKGSNIQDNAVVHVDENLPCTIGENVTVGHNAILHSCTVRDGCTIGMGAIVLNNADIGENSMVGAGALVTQGKNFPAGSLILGSPAKLIRSLTAEEIEAMKKNCENYIRHAQEALRDGAHCGPGEKIEQ
ncbi:gamma carbonic anhydrase family protein [Treponema lecithinolyticum]|uniref:gamma carbonic anhydrase family protein n=1 Tax=Treponema lecithinolyticum TaxID=53418 RepID=UPI0028F147AF|nr:gamma carbonic anhydrase family protein [Treponema lecithinolyticum]